jgi:hypothetical protein
VQELYYLSTYEPPRRVAGSLYLVFTFHFNLVPTNIFFINTCVLNFFLQLFNNSVVRQPLDSWVPKMARM